MSFEIIGIDCKCGARFMASLKPGKITCPSCGAADEITMEMMQSEPN